jgi:hypothetical protein
VHSITAPPFLCSAGAFHRRAMLFSFGRRISSPRRILFVRPAHPIIVPQSLRLPVHLPPIHRFGVVPFIRRIPRRAATDLVLFCLAGACPADRLFGVIPFIRRIPRRAATDLVLLHLAGAFPANLVSLFAGAFAANPPIWCCSIWLAHPLAAPPLPI